MDGEETGDRRGPRAPVCGYAPPEDPALACDRRHRQGEGNHLDSARGLWFGRTAAGDLRTYPYGWEPAATISRGSGTGWRDRAAG